MFKIHKQKFIKIYKQQKKIKKANNSFEFVNLKKNDKVKYLSDNNLIKQQKNKTLENQGNYIINNMPSTLQFYYILLKILPEGILLLGNKIFHIQFLNKNIQEILQIDSKFLVEKLLSLKNSEFKEYGNDKKDDSTSTNSTLKGQTIYVNQCKNLKSLYEKIIKLTNYQLKKNFLQGIEEQSQKFIMYCNFNNKKNQNEDDIKNLEITCVPTIIDNQSSVLFVIKDISNIKKLNYLQILNENKSKMLSQVAHEFRTPLNCIISLIEIAEEQNTYLHQFLKPALISAQQLNFMVNDILDFTQIKANKFSLNYQIFDFLDLIKQIILLLNIEARKKQIELLYQYDPQLPTFIHSDQNRIRQVLINLIGNALKFTKQGSITIIVKKKLVNKILVQVKDTGIGIQEKDQQKLFYAFGKINGEEENLLNPKGVGLGLMISHMLAKILGGEEGLHVESEYGKGSCFQFMVMNQIEKQQEVDKIIQNNKFTFQRNKYRAQNILIIDDNQFNILVLKARIQNITKAQIQTALSGKDAMKIVKQKYEKLDQYFQLIFLDLSMPDIDGYQTFNLLKQFYNEKKLFQYVNVVACSGYQDCKEQNKAMKVGMTDYLTKPIDKVKLQQILSKYL
ncbi:phospholipid-translocating p-type flippase family protein, putative [Ichthyophthirius multifiliis]|uniref:Phospholipid-translocating p-type flippase family protein, putative n=1 Tax=Ichthyophthirius multifiliis TaxID=5932 RepID=G0QYK6_ICHMU|nr:phospholipid-translocating p-type flippase family protein, putative [Ichthyophthirius multifiliis]EGR29697.1 phospholipid-translocating p-type flippase family protein, putative [Ichthyophthirius multifiliis]|eukprot:XP_004030933.1 phospholipid-translocating p-type flippase family protein, putative [Ichthyophthirius multifiliis]